VSTAVRRASSCFFPSAERDPVLPRFDHMRSHNRSRGADVLDFVGDRAAVRRGSGKGLGERLSRNIDAEDFRPADARS